MKEREFCDKNLDIVLYKWKELEKRQLQEKLSSHLTAGWNKNGGVVAVDKLGRKEVVEEEAECGGGKATMGLLMVSTLLHDLVEYHDH